MNFTQQEILSPPKLMCDKKRKRERVALPLLLGLNHFAHGLYTSVPQKDGV